jgi:AcrR family transcriptional regulator
MSIRSLAGELGIAPMSVYRHVRDKDDLLDEVVDRLLVRTWKPRADESDWKAWTAEAADRLRHFLVAQPAALHVYLSHPVVSPAALARMATIMRVLRAALGDEEDAVAAYAAIHTYTVGFAALEASRARQRPVGAGGGRAGEPEMEATRESGQPVGARDSVDDSQVAVHNREMTRRLASYATPRQFAVGLNLLLTGIEQNERVQPGAAN